MTIELLRTDTPIYQIVVKGNEISEYYAQRSKASFHQFGYKNIRRVNAVTPETLTGRVNFSDERRYSSGRTREWDVFEKAIWESHSKAWSMIRKPSIIIEHDCILEKPIIKRIINYPLYSFGYTIKEVEEKTIYKSLAAVGYFIQPYMARELRRISLEETINGPVDGYIHQYQPWYPWRFKQRYFDKWVFARHYVNEEVGTVKVKLL